MIHHRSEGRPLAADEPLSDVTLPFPGRRDGSNGIVNWPRKLFSVRKDSDRWPTAAGRACALVRKNEIQTMSCNTPADIDQLKRRTQKRNVIN
jgi:hypothetical protein